MAETSNQVVVLHAKRLRGPHRNLNDLPDEILLHILSFLPTLEAIHSSLISRKWRPLWSLVPSLNFSYDLFPFTADSESAHAELFADFIDRTLIIRPDSPVRTFRLSFIFDQGYGIQVDSWIHCAVSRLKARQLHLDFFIDDHYHGGDSWLHDFNFSLLRNGCVEILRLTHCFLMLPANMSTMNLCSLTSLFIERIDLTDQMVRDLISGCPNLDDLELRSCVGLQNLNICSTRLEKLALGYDYDTESKQTIEIDCPNLCSLSFSDCNSAQFVLKKAPSLVEFCVDFACLTDKYFDLWSKIVRLLEQMPRVNKLNVQNWWYKLLISKDPFPKDFKLNNLNHLELRTGYTQYDLVGMAALLQLCPNLETMVLDELKHDESLPEELLNKPVEFEIPRLKQVTMKTYGATEDELNFVTILKKQAVNVVLEKLD